MVASKMIHATLALSIALGGCLGGGADDANVEEMSIGSATADGNANDTFNEPEPSEPAETLAMHLEDCFEAGWIRNPPREALQALLPEGFVAGRAAEFPAEILGVPGIADQVPADAGLIGVGPFSCEERADTGAPFALTNYVIYVEPPVVPGHELLPAQVNMYLPLYTVTDADVAAALVALGFPAVQAELEMGIDLGPATNGWASAATANGSIFNYELQGHMPTGDVDQSYRIWHAPSDGLSYIHQDLEPRDVAFTGITACSSPDPGVMFGSCEPEDWGVLGAPTDATLTFVHLPGATLAP